MGRQSKERKAIVISETEKKWTCRCVICGKEITDFKSNRGGKPPKYCSYECYHKGDRIDYGTRKCKQCGKDFTIPVKRPQKEFCNYKCASAYKHDNCTPRPWKGKDGYRYLHIMGRGKVQEHVLIMEEHIGRRLEKTEVVHHIDGTRDNNDISNLLLLTRSEHSALHRAIEKQQGKDFFGRKNNEHKQ